VLSDQLAQGREQLAEALEARLPEDFGQVTIMSEDNLGALQTAAVRLDRLVWGLVILSAILVAATFAISPTRRRTAVHLGIGVAAALGLSLIAVGELESAVVDQFVDPGSQESARVLVARLLVALRNTMLVIGVISLLVAIVAYLAGRPSWLRRASDEVSGLTDPEAPASDLDIWVAAHNDGLRIVGLAIAIGAAVLLIGGRPIPLLVLGGVLALYLWAVAQATKRVEEVTNEGAQPTVSEKIGVPDE
jgi:hypothetical protein